MTIVVTVPDNIVSNTHMFNDYVPVFDYRDHFHSKRNQVFSGSLHRNKSKDQLY